MPCSLKFHNLVIYVLKVFLFGIICGSFQFVPQPPVVLPAFFSVHILPFPSFIHFTDHFLCNPWFSCSLHSNLNSALFPCASVVYLLITSVFLYAFKSFIITDYKQLWHTSNSVFQTTRVDRLWMKSGSVHLLLIDIYYVVKLKSLDVSETRAIHQLSFQGKCVLHCLSS